MKERIKEISIEVGNNCVDFYSHDIDFNVIEDGLRQIATEQKAIDAQNAIKAHCSFCEAHNACAHRGSFFCPETEYIRKAMEE